MPKRQGNNPRRRIAPSHEIDADALDCLLEKASYTGSAHHKRAPGDYDFQPPTSPRPNKSLCDGKRTVRRNEATALFRKGIARGMVSSFRMGEFPKYVWAVDAAGRAYEAKLEKGSGNYHGYGLGDDDDAMRWLVVNEWQTRCPVR